MGRVWCLGAVLTDCCVMRHGPSSKWNSSVDRQLLGLSPCWPTEAAVVSRMRVWSLLARPVSCRFPFRACRHLEYQVVASEPRREAFQHAMDLCQLCLTDHAENGTWFSPFR